MDPWKTMLTARPVKDRLDDAPAGQLQPDLYLETLQRTLKMMSYKILHLEKQLKEQRVHGKSAGAAGQPPSEVRLN